MGRAPLRRLTGRTAVLPADDVDTDQIIPARFLKGTSRDGLGRCLFADRPDAPLGTGADLLVAGRNFGCGSSREHAVWALLDHGFRAVLALSFGDIFFGNALKNGLVPVALPPAAHQRLLQAPGAEVTIDVEALYVTLPDGNHSRREPPDAAGAFSLPPFARHCLLQGLDELTFLLSHEPLIADYERRAAFSREG
jgi:3-isopropylmalate/(R)-2-methylmalate dehydratase small subunit